jgi:hypothetical protein
MIGGAFDSLAVDLRVAVVARATATGRSVILAVALRIDRALVIQDARIHALAVVTGGCVIALAVGFAVDYNAEWRLRKLMDFSCRRKHAFININDSSSSSRGEEKDGTLTLEASQLRISRVTRRADAGRIVVNDVALGIGSAVARIDACAVDARIVARTFAVRRAFWHDIRCRQKIENMRSCHMT